MTRVEAWRKTKGYLYDILDIAEADEIIETLEQDWKDCIRRSDVSLTDFEIVMCNGDYKEGLKMLLEKIEKAPPVSPQLKIGHWIKHNTGHSIYYDCSRCGCAAPCTETADGFIWKLSNFCPDCGARNRESEDKQYEILSCNRRCS